MQVRVGREIKITILMPTLKIRFSSEASYSQLRIDKTTILEVHHPYDNTFDIQLSESKLYYLAEFKQQMQRYVNLAI